MSSSPIKALYCSNEWGLKTATAISVWELGPSFKDRFTYAQIKTRIFGRGWVVGSTYAKKPQGYTAVQGATEIFSPDLERRGVWTLRLVYSSAEQGSGWSADRLPEPSPSVPQGPGLLAELTRRPILVCLPDVIVTGPRNFQQSAPCWDGMRTKPAAW